MKKRIVAFVISLIMISVNVFGCVDFGTINAFAEGNDDTVTVLCTDTNNVTLSSGWAQKHDDNLNVDLIRSKTLNATAQFSLNITNAADYDVYVMLNVGGTNKTSTPIPVTINHNGKTDSTTVSNVDEKYNSWTKIGTYDFSSGEGNNVIFTSPDSENFTAIVGVKFVKYDSQSSTNNEITAITFDKTSATLEDTGVDGKNTVSVHYNIETQSTSAAEYNIVKKDPELKSLGKSDWVRQANVTYEVTPDNDNPNEGTLLITSTKSSFGMVRVQMQSTTDESICAFIDITVEQARDPQYNTVKTEVENGTMWLDTEGRMIWCNTGTISYLLDDPNNANGTGTYYWYGSKVLDDGTTYSSMVCYSSRDCINWKYEGVKIDNSTMGNGLANWLGRGSLFYNAKYNYYSMVLIWAPMDSSENNYGKKHYAFLTSNSPLGPWQITGKNGETTDANGNPLKMNNYGSDWQNHRYDNTGIWDGGLVGNHGSRGSFQADDGTVYMMFTDGEEGTHDVANLVKLNDRYTYIEGYPTYDELRALDALGEGTAEYKAKAKEYRDRYIIWRSNEAGKEGHGMFEVGDYYYWFSSATAGWSSSRTFFKKILDRDSDGIEREECGYAWGVTETSANGAPVTTSSFDTQHAGVCKVITTDGNTNFFLIGDRWSMKKSEGGQNISNWNNGFNAFYPIAFDSNGSPVIIGPRSLSFDPMDPESYEYPYYDITNDNFDESNTISSTQWNSAKGSFTINNYFSNTIKNASQTGKAIIINKDSNYTDYQVQAQFLPFDGVYEGTCNQVTNRDSYTGTAGVIARYQDANNYYVFRMTNNKFVLSKVVNGKETVLGTKAATNDNRWNYRLRLEVKGDSLKCYVDNADIVISKTDSTFKSGKAGIYAEEDTFSIDDYRQFSLTKPQQSLANKSELNSTISTAALKNEADYTSASWQTFVNALSAANEATNNADATQDEVDNAKVALLNAMSALKSAAVSPTTPTTPTTPTAPTASTTTTAPDSTLTQISVTTEDVDTAFKNSAQGSTVNVKIKKKSTIDKSALEIIKGKDVEVIVENDNGIKFEFNGKDIPDDWNGIDIDFGATLNDSKIPEDVLKTIESTNDVVIPLSLSHEGVFGFDITMKVSFSKDKAGKIATLFYYNPATQKFEETASAVIDKDGIARMTLKHASEYVITVSEANTTTPSSNADTSIPETGESNNLLIIISIILTSLYTIEYSKKRITNK